MSRRADRAAADRRGASLDTHALPPPTHLSGPARGAARVEVRAARYPEDLEVVRAMLREYRAWLVEHREVTDFDDAILARGLEWFDAEVASVPELYDGPGGAFYLAIRETVPVGSAGLRRIDAGTGELKRLYVRAGARGLGVGSRLVAAVLDRAGQIGYRRVVLDTLPAMHEAIRIYRALGARPIPAYWPHPVSNALFFEFDLKAASRLHNA